MNFDFLEVVCDIFLYRLRVFLYRDKYSGIVRSKKEYFFKLVLFVSFVDILSKLIFLGDEEDSVGSLGFLSRNFVFLRVYKV